MDLRLSERLDVPVIKEGIPTLQRNVAVLKPDKEPELVGRYRSIALLSVCYKAAGDTSSQKIINHSKCIDKARFSLSLCSLIIRVALTIYIKKISAAYFYLCTGYDTVWRKGLIVKLYNLIFYLFCVLEFHPYKQVNLKS